MHLLAGKFFQDSAQQVAHIILLNQLLLLVALQQLPPQSIHRLALLVHHVVVLKQMLTGFKVLALPPPSAPLQCAA